MNWIKTSESLPEVGDEVIGQNKSWIDEDCNPDGICMCFLNESKDGYWLISKWCMQHDEWHTRYSDKQFATEMLPEMEPPTFWMSKPTQP